MRKCFMILSVLFVLSSCKTAFKVIDPVDETIYSSVEIDTLFQDNISIRSIVVDGNKIWYSANKSRFGYYDLQSSKKIESKIVKDSLQLEFRSAAQTAKNIFVMPVSNPALLFQVSKKDLKTTLVYEERHEKVFYDSMQFWNNKEGIAMGDPVSNCLSVIVTRDGGASWNKLDCDQLPKVSNGEAAFAASNTNIVVKGNNTWIVTGGVKARVLFSSDKGISWQSYDTPIVQGKSMTGIFTADFYDAKQGFIAGGDYEVLNQNQGNKAVSVNGGKSWSLIADNSGFGYTSCIQYVPKSGGKSLVSVGASGIYYSYDSGLTWKQFSTDASLYTIRFIDNQTAVAAGKDKMIRIKFKNKTLNN